MCKLCLKETIKTTINSFGCLDDAQLGKRVEQTHHAVLVDNERPKTQNLQISKEQEINGQSLANEISFLINLRKAQNNQQPQARPTESSEVCSDDKKTQTSVQSLVLEQKPLRGRSLSVRKLIKTSNSTKFGEIRVPTDFKPNQVHNSMSLQKHINIGSSSL